MLHLAAEGAARECVPLRLPVLHQSALEQRAARFTRDEVVRLTLDFHKRNHIEGLFLGGGIIRGADYINGTICPRHRSSPT
jgi:predicted DNA-binding helix-hairpin-helix protein